MATRRNSLTPSFGFNDATGQYFWLDGPNKGRFVPRTEVRRVIDEYLEKKSQNVRGLAEQLRNREISIAQWQSAMEQNIARVHLANLAAAKGGWHNLTQSDYGRVGQLVREEYKYLRRFAEQIENKLPLDGHFMQRAEQYAQAGRHTYHVVESREMLARGYDEQRFIRHAGDSCEDCVALAALGWHATGSTPEPGERKCKRKCKCTKEYRKSSQSPDGKQIEESAGDGGRDGAPRREDSPKLTFRDLKEAEKWAKDKGIKVDFGGRLDIAQAVNRAVEEAANRGLRVPSRIKVSAEHFRGYHRAKSIPAECTPNSGELFINPESNSWKQGTKSASKVARKNYNEGHWSTDHAQHTLRHEIGHLNRRGKGGVLSDMNKSLIREKVSNRATENADEFVAEVFAGLMQSPKNSQKFGTEIMELYFRYGGPKIS